VICTAATFPDMPAARRTREALERRKFPPVQVYLCGKCDRYHFRGSSPDLRMWKTMSRVLHLCALGFTAATIAEMTGYTKFTVKRALEDLRQWFGALNMAHLVAIAIALGYLDPNEFIPPVIDKEHCNDPRQGNRAHKRPP